MTHRPKFGEAKNVTILFSDVVDTTSVGMV